MPLLPAATLLDTPIEFCRADHKRKRAFCSLLQLMQRLRDLSAPTRRNVAVPICVTIGIDVRETE